MDLDRLEGAVTDGCEAVAKMMAALKAADYTMEAINRAVPPPSGVQPERSRAGRTYFGGGETGQGVGEGEGVGSASSGQTGEDEGANDAAAAAAARAGEEVSPAAGGPASPVF
jgi:hypothetical protein